MKICLLLLAVALAVAACAGVPGIPTPSRTPVSPTRISQPPPEGPTDQPTKREPTPIYGHSTSEARTPITVLLVLAKAPRLDEPVVVTLVITAAQDAPGATAEILLPPGAEAVEGILAWTGDLSAQQSQQLQATIKFTREGDWTLAGKALRPAGGRDVWGDLAVIYLRVTREAGQVGFPEGPNAPHGGGQAPPPPLDPKHTR